MVGGGAVVAAVVRVVEDEGISDSIYDTVTTSVPRIINEQNFFAVTT